MIPIPFKKLLFLIQDGPEVITAVYGGPCIYMTGTLTTTFGWKSYCKVCGK